MGQQHSENLLRRFKGQVATIKTISGGVYEGRIAEVTDDYVCLLERKDEEQTEVFVFFNALESMVVGEAPAV